MNIDIAPRWVLCSRRDQKDGSDFPYESPDAGEIDFVADGDAHTPMENALSAIKAMRARANQSAIPFKQRATEDGLTADTDVPCYSKIQSNEDRDIRTRKIRHNRAFL